MFDADQEHQECFTDLEYSCRKRKTKREEFLNTMNAIMTWDEVIEIKAPYYFSQCNFLGGEMRFREAV